VFAFETTRQPLGLLPLLGGCTAAFLVSCVLMKHTIMTEKIARRGARVPGEYTFDFLDQVLARESASRPVVTLAGDDTVEHVRAWIASGATGASHQGFPVVDKNGDLIGVVTRRDLLETSVVPGWRVWELVKRAPAVVYEDSSLREAADHMVRQNIGRLPVVTRARPRRVTGMLTRSDLLAAHRRRLDEVHRAEQTLRRRAALRPARA
jgi:CBS domain-containing protein